MSLDKGDVAVLWPTQGVAGASSLGGARQEQPTAGPLELARLTELMNASTGSPEVRIALIDGPVMFDHPDLAVERVRHLPGDVGAACSSMSSFACRHGTFVAGVLAARRGSAAPGICPGCTLLVRPVFAETPPSLAAVPTARPEELAKAILESVDAGANLINLSSALFLPSAEDRRGVQRALDHATTQGVITIAAAGNQGLVGGSVITRHPGVIPVVAYDGRGRPMGLSNFGQHIGRRGLGAPGADVTSLGPPGEPETSGGTSAAAPFVTGTLALLRSLFPAATAVQLRTALRQSLGGRTVTVVPPLLNASAAYQYLSKLDEQRSGTPMTQQSANQLGDIGRSQSRLANSMAGGGLVAPAQVAAGNCCPPAGAGAAQPAEAATPPGAGEGNAEGNGQPQASLVFAIGRIETSFPNLAVEKEFAQAMGRDDLSGQSDQEALVSVLTNGQNRYLARAICWVFTVQGLPTYILRPNDPRDFDLLLEALRPERAGDDLDVVIGVRGAVAPPELCNGLELPMVAFEQIYSFPRQELVEAIPRPESVAKGKFEGTARDLLTMIMQIADNAGSEDEHRALNYLAVRYPAIYANAAEAHGRNLSLSGIEVRPSRLATTERIVDVILAYTHRETDVTEKFFVRVNVTSMFPFLVSKLAPYFDR